MPTTVTDLAADTGAGDTTFAVRFGPRFAHRLGVALWAAALAFSLLCARLDVLVPRSTLVPQLLMAPVLLAAYAVLTRRPTITRLAVLSLLFGVPTSASRWPTSGEAMRGPVPGVGYTSRTMSRRAPPPPLPRP